MPVDAATVALTLIGLVLTSIGAGTVAAKLLFAATGGR
jgi:hypothetical protein